MSGGVLHDGVVVDGAVGGHEPLEGDGDGGEDGARHGDVVEGEEEDREQVDVEAARLQGRRVQRPRSRAVNQPSRSFHSTYRRPGLGGRCAFGTLVRKYHK